MIVLKKKTEGNEVSKEKKKKEPFLQKEVTVTTFQSSNMPCFKGS